MNMTPGAVRLLFAAVDRADSERSIARMREMRTAMHAEPKKFAGLMDTLHRIVRRARG